MKIMLFVPDLRGGGVERVCLLLSREFLAKGHDVELVLLRKEGDLLGQVPAQVRIVELQASRLRHGLIPLVQYLRKHKPDAFIASMWPMTTLAVLAASLARFRGRIIISEHNALTLSVCCTGVTGFALRTSMRWVNGRADSVVGVSQGVIEDLHTLGLPREIGTVIYNPIAITYDTEVPDSWLRHPWFMRDRAQRLIAVGSLKEQKDYPTLLSSMSKLVNSGEDVSLLILGVGPLLSKLEAQRSALGLINHVHFGGFVKDPAPFYRSASLFVLSSAWEGFGNVIVEAMAAGTPVVSTDCRSGPAEILENGRYGKLVPVGDAEALAKAIGESLTSTHDPEKLRARAADFSAEKISEMYLKVLSP